VHFQRNDYQTLRWFSTDGIRWTGWEKVGDPNVWLWRVSWWGGQAYAMGYGTTEDGFIRLYESGDGLSFTPVGERLLSDGFPNECALSFLPDGTCLGLLRRDGKNDSGLFGVSRPPYASWEWKDLGRRIGGPKLLALPDGRLLAAVRLYEGGIRTSLCRIDADHGSLTEFLWLPSDGDTGYAGMVCEDGILWVSYYSSHEGKASIYLAKVRVQDL
jgi:hypothetical protein